VVPVADESREVVAVFDSDVRIHLVSRAEDLAFHTNGPRALLGIVTPKSDAPLRLQAASPGALRVALDVRGVLANPSPVTDELLCPEVSVVPVKFDARASVTKRKDLPRRWVGPSSAPIAAQKGGPTLATLHSGVELGVLEVRGPLTLVIAEDVRFVVSGWVDTRALTALPSVGMGFGTGTGRLGSYGVGHLTLPTCTRALTLIGELAAERAIIGRIPPGTPYRVIEEASERPGAEGGTTTEQLVPVSLPHSVWLRLGPSARLLVPRRELDSCRRATPPTL
jgi:hypothetical protein